MLETKYKIFARINFHHRSIRNAATLQFVVSSLILNFLQETAQNNVINEEINGLWYFIHEGAGQRSLRVINWNDSWLTAVLNNSLGNLVGLNI